MKVIKLVPWSYTFTCKGCKSELEVEPEDVQFGRFGCFDEFESEYYVNCVVCKEHHTMPQSQVATNVKNVAEKKYREQKV